MTLLWYTSAYYEVTVQAADTRCIAPRYPKEKDLKLGSKLSERCGWSLTPGDAARVEELQQQVCTSNNEQDIVRTIRQLVLARCCTSGLHRDKLSCHAACRRAVAESYLAMFSKNTMLKVKVQGGMVLADTDIIDGAGMTPYSGDPADTVKKAMYDEIKVAKKSRKGLVYAFTMSKLPGIVKIGYTSESWDVRKGQFERDGCMPEPQLVATMEDICFPARMERLVHLQFHQHRRKMVRCPKCERTHHEFFELPVSKVKEVFNEWHTLAKKEPLYDTNDCLTEAWYNRLASMTTVTAFELLKVLEEEGIKKENAKAVFEKVLIEKDPIEKKDSNEKDSNERDSNEKDSNEENSNEKGSNEKDSNEKDNNEKVSNEKASNEKASNEKASNEDENEQINAKSTSSSMTMAEYDSQGLQETNPATKAFVLLERTSCETTAMPSIKHEPTEITRPHSTSHGSQPDLSDSLPSPVKTEQPLEDVLGSMTLADCEADGPNNDRLVVVLKTKLHDTRNGNKQHPSPTPLDVLSATTTSVDCSL